MGIIKDMLNKGSNDNITPSNILNNDDTLTPINITENFKTQESPLSSYLKEHNYDIDSKEYIKGKYEKYGVYVSPNSTEEDLRKAKSKNQGWLEQAGYSLAQIGVNEILLGSIKGFSDIYDFIYNTVKHDEPNDYTNAVSLTLEKAQDSVREKFEIYRENPNKSFDVTDFGWWADNFITVGSTVSLMIPSYGVNMALSGASKFLRLNKLSANVFKNAANIGNRVTKGKNLLFNPINASREFNALAGATVSGVTSRIAENYMEARESYKAAYDYVYDALENFNDVEKENFFKNNTQYINKNNEEIAKDIASKSGSDTFKRDMWLLGIDVFQYKSLSKLLSKPLKNTATSRLIRKKAIKALNSPVEGTFDISLKEKLKEALSYSIKHPYEIIKSIPFNEGIEEGWQGISQELSEDYYNTIINPNYSKRSIEDLLTDATIWEQAFWGVLGGFAFKKIDSGVNAIKESINNQRNKKLYNTNIDKQKLTEEQMYKNIIENNFSSFNKLVSDINDVNNKKIEGIKAENITQEIINNKKEEIIEDFLVNMVKNSKDTRTYDLFKELITNENFGKYLENRNVQTNDVKIINDGLLNKVEQISNLYDNYLNLVHNGIKEANTDITRMVASDLTRRKLLINRLKKANNNIDEKINNLNVDEKTNLNYYKDMSTITVYNQAIEENQKEFNKHKKEFENKEISKSAFEKYKEEYNKNKKIYNEYLQNINQEIIISYGVNELNTVNDNIYVHFDTINKIEDEQEREKALNNLLNNILLNYNNEIGIANEEIANLSVNKALNDLSIEVQNTLMPNNTKELREIYDDLTYTLSDFIDKSLTNSFKKLSNYIEKSNNPDEEYYKIISEDENLPKDILDAAFKLKLGYKDNEFYLKGIQSIVNNELNKRNKELINFNTTKVNDKKVEGKEKEDIDNKANEVETSINQDGVVVPSTGELTEEEKRIKEDVEKDIEEERKKQIISKEEELYINQEAEYQRDKLELNDFIIKHVNRKEFIDIIKNIKEIGDDNYNAVYNAIKQELKDLQGINETKSSIITNENIHSILRMLLQSQKINKTDKEKYLFLASELSNRIIIEQNGITDLFSLTPFIQDEEKVKQLLNEFILSYFDNYGITNNVIDVDKFFDDLLNDENIDYETIKTIFLNFDKIYKLQGLNITNDELYKQNLKDSVNYFTILKEKKALVENINTYMHINAPTKKTENYNKALKLASKGSPIIVESVDNTISFKVKVDEEFVEIGFIVKVKPLNNKNTSFSLVTHPMFNWRIELKDGKLTSNYDDLFINIFNDDEIKSILKNYYNKRNKVKDKDIKILEKFLTKLYDKTRNVWYNNLINNLKNQPNQFINYISSIVLFNGNTLTDEKAYKESYELWLDKMYNNYESTYMLQQKIEEIENNEDLSKENYIITKLESLGVPKIEYDEELKDANSLPFELENNPLLAFDKTGQVIAETGKNKFIPNSIFRKGEMGFLIKNVRGNPIMAKIKDSNNISSSPILNKLVKQELTNILTEFYDTNIEIDTTFNKLKDLISTNPLFKGYDVFKSKNRIMVTKKSNTNIENKNILFILYENKDNDNISRALTVFNDEGKRYISDIDGYEIPYTRLNKHYINFTVEKILEGLYFYPSYFAFNAKGKAKYGDNKYFYKENNKFIIKIGDTELSYNTYFDVVMQNNMFKVDVKYNEENQSFDFNEQSEQDLYINIDEVQKTVDIIENDNKQLNLNNAISLIENATKTKGVKTKDLLSAFGYDKIINFLNYIQGGDKYNIFNSTTYYDSEENEYYAKYDKKKKKIFISKKGVQEIRKNPDNLLRLLSHENVHRAINELNSFENDYVVYELMETYNQFITRLNEDVNKGIKEAIIIKNWIDENNFKPDNQFIKNDDNNRIFAEEWLVESTTNGPLIQYLNSIEYNGNIEKTEKPTLFQKILEIFSTIFGKLFDNIKENSILAKNISIFNNKKDLNNPTPMIVNDNGVTTNFPVEGESSPTDENKSVLQSNLEKSNKTNEVAEIELDDMDDFLGDIGEDDELNLYSSIPEVKTDIESKLNTYADNKEVNPNGFYTIRNMDDFMKSFPDKLKPKIASELDSNQIKFLCR